MAKIKPGRVWTSKRTTKPTDLLASLPTLNRDIAVVEIDNPHEADVKHARVKALINRRESPVERWYAKGQIDGAQYQAANLLREAWETLTGGAPQSPALQEAVDTSFRHRDGITDRKKQAAMLLGRVQKAVGYLTFWSYVQATCCERFWPIDIAGGNRRRAEYIASAVKECLEAIAVECRVAVRRRL